MLGTALIDGNIVQLSYVVTNGTAANGAQTFTAGTSISGFFDKYLTVRL